MHIRLTKHQILSYAEYYLDLPLKVGVSNSKADKRTERKYRAVRHRGHMTADDLKATGWWKCRGNRLANQLDKNTSDEVAEITRVSFSATTERLHIGALLALNGVSWPMAIVILHFAFPNRYPVLDVRVMHIIDCPCSYDFSSWTRIAEFCRNKSAEYGVTMRELDRGLWTYHKKRFSKS